jgi:putative tricarboxylic transport membrane protein
MAEQQLRRALAISQGDASVLLTRPLSGTLLAVAVLVLVAPPLIRRFGAASPRLRTRP